MYSTNRSAKACKPPVALQSTGLFAAVKERVRYLHYSLRTEEAYVYWIRHFVSWHGRRHPRQMGAADVQAFLSMLANERQVSPATHRQALSAILFLYREVLGQDLPWMNEIGRPPDRKRIPAVLTAAEVAALLDRIDGEPEALLARLLYGTGMRLAEGLARRVKDVDFARGVIVVREGKGAKDRVVMLPRVLEPALQQQLAKSRSLWMQDRQADRSGVMLPHALEAKYPRAGLTWAWFWVFPAMKESTDPRSGVIRQRHLFEQRLQRAIKPATARAGIDKPAMSRELLNA